MGGFALHDVDKSFLRVLDEKTLKELDEAGEIEWPTITKKEIQDRSKADIFSKGIVLMQTTWFIVQCISRFATKLAVTELEVVTLAFAVLNAITYWLWWDKPSDVRCAVPVYLKSAESSNPKVSNARHKPDTDISVVTKQDGFLASFRSSFERRCDKQGLILTILYTFIWAPIKVIFGPLVTMLDQDEIPDEDITRVPTFYSPEEKMTLDGPPSFWTMMGVVALFGAIHFIPWPFTFPTAAEKWLWRVSAILITGGPLLPVFLPIIAALVWYSILGPILNRITNFISNTILNTIWNTIVNTISNSILNTIWNTIVKSISNSILNTIWNTIVKSISYSISDSILDSILDALLQFVALTLIAAYIISRIILLILPLMLLRDLPPTALHELKWSEFFPHI